MTALANFDLMDETDVEDLDIIKFETDVTELSWDNKSLMPELNVDGELSSDDLLMAFEQFSLVFTDRYPTSGPALYMGSLDQALAHSLFDPVKPCSLVLSIHHDQSIASNIFCTRVLCADKITDYLAENFIVWAWDRTSDINYRRLWTMLRTHVGDDVVEVIASSPIDAYPLLICLAFDKGQVNVVTVIQGTMSDDKTFSLLKQVRDAFDSRIEQANLTNTCVTSVSNEGWFMSESLLTRINRNSEEFQRISHEFVGDNGRVVSIDEVKNSMWLFEYLNNMESIDARLGSSQNGRILVYHCSQLTAKHILQNGFTHNLINTHGRKKYGKGFYFSSPLSLRHFYPGNKRLHNNERTMIVCHVLVGRSYQGGWKRETCPAGYDSTTNGSDIYVVYSNRNILPKYLINYK